MVNAGMHAVQLRICTLCNSARPKEDFTEDEDWRCIQCISGSNDSPPTVRGKTSSRVFVPSEEVVTLTDRVGRLLNKLELERNEEELQNLRIQVIQQGEELQRAKEDLERSIKKENQLKSSLQQAKQEAQAREAKETTAETIEPEPDYETQSRPRRIRRITSGSFSCTVALVELKSGLLTVHFDALDSNWDDLPDPMQSVVYCFPGGAEVIAKDHTYSIENENHYAGTLAFDVKESQSFTFQFGGPKSNYPIVHVYGIDFSASVSCGKCNTELRVEHIKEIIGGAPNAVCVNCFKTSDKLTETQQHDQYHHYWFHCDLAEEIRIHGNEYWDLCYECWEREIATLEENPVENEEYNWDNAKTDGSFSSDTRIAELSVKCVNGTGWRDESDWVGNMDPYCRITVEGVSEETHVHIEGGTIANWDQTFIFKNVSNSSEIIVEVFDKDMLASDYVGKGSILISKVDLETAIKVPLVPFGYVTIVVSRPEEVQPNELSILSNDDETIVNANQKYNWVIVKGGGWRTHTYLEEKKQTWHNGSLHKLNKDGSTRFLQTLTSDQPWVARWWLEDVPQVALHTYTSPSMQGSNALHVAIQQDNPDMVDLVLDSVSHDKVIELLNGQAQGTNFGLEWGEYPLFFVMRMRNKRKAVFDKLLKLGANLFHSTTENRDSILHIIVRNFQSEGICEMYDRVVAAMNQHHGLDAELWRRIRGHCLARTNKQGLSPLALAAQLDTLKMFYHIMQANRPLREPNLWALDGVDYHCQMPEQLREQIQQNKALAKMFCEENSINTTKSSKFKAAMVRIWDGKTDNQENESEPDTVLQVLVRGDDEKNCILQSELIAHIINSKWNLLKERYYTNLARSVFLNFLFMTNLCLTKDTHWIVKGFVYVMVLVLTSHKFIKELREVWLNGLKKHFVTCSWVVWLDNVMSMSYSILFFTSLLFGSNVVMAMAGLSLWLYMLFFFLISKDTGPLVISVMYMIVHDVVRFVLLFSVCLMAFATAKKILTPETELNDVIWDTLLLSLTGDGIPTESVAQRTWGITWLIFSATVLINMLIGMMGDSYGEISEKASTLFLKLRLSLLFELEDDPSQMVQAPFLERFDPIDQMQKRYIRFREPKIEQEESVDNSQEQFRKELQRAMKREMVEMRVQMQLVKEEITEEVKRLSKDMKAMREGRSIRKA